MKMPKAVFLYTGVEAPVGRVEGGREGEEESGPGLRTRRTPTLQQMAARVSKRDQVP
jgi:hypothetical protein